MRPVLLFVAAVSWLTASATLPLAAAQERPTWPPTPGSAAVRFVRSLNPSAVRGKPSLFSRVLSLIVGARDEPTMAQPYAMAVGPDGKLYVVDSTAGLIHVYGLTKSEYRTMRVDAESLIGITFAGRRMIVTDSVAGRVLCLDLDGRTLWTLGRKDGFIRPTGVAASSGELYVVDTIGHWVVVVSPTGAVVRHFGTRGIEPGQLNYPTNIATDRAGRLYVTDTLNFRVQVFDREGRFLDTFGRLGDGPGDFDKPKGIAVDDKGRIYVVEGLHDVVQIFDSEGRLLLVFGGSGTGPGQLWLPAGIALSGNTVYVADTANRRVQVFERLGEAQ